MTRKVKTRPKQRTAFSLLEMVLSLSVLAVAFTAVGSVFVLATKVMPTPDSAEAASVDQCRALTRMVEDLEQARYITGGSANSITFVVDDRTGDGLPERLTYAWSGKEGDPLTLTVNGSDPVPIANDVRAFSLAGETQTRVDRVAGVSESSAEQLLTAHDSATFSATASITRDWHVGQVFLPTLPVNATSYTVTRFLARVKRNGVSSGGVYAQLRGFQPDTLSLLPIDSQLRVYESEFGTAYGTFDFVFPEPATYDAGSPAAVTIDWEFGSVAADFEYDDADGSGVLWSTDGGSNWSLYSGKSMVAAVYGRVNTQTPTIEVTRTVFTEARVTLRVGSATAQQATARLYTEPGVHNAVWDAGFDASPVGLDMDGDGPDWKAQSGGAAGSFSDGRWEVDGLLCTQPTDSFDEPTVVDLVMGVSSASGRGAVFRMNADQADGLAVPLTVCTGCNASGVYRVRVYDTEKLDSPRLDIRELGDNPPRIRLLIVPADNAVGVIINGKPAGSFYYEPVAADGLPGLARLTEGADGFFDHVSIRVGASAVVTSPAGAESDSGSDEGGDGLIGGLLNGLLGR